jgi:ABC-type Fe3+-siderophore transport system permease subunit
MASVTHDVVHEAAAERARVAQPYANPYLAGIGLGLVLLAAFVLVGRGLGASGAFNSTIAWLVSLVVFGYARANEFLAGYFEGGTHPLKAWLVFEVVGVFVGALLSGLLAGRVARTVEKGPRV